MATNTVSTVQKFIEDLSGNKNVKNLISDFQKISKDIKQTGHDLNLRLNAKKQKTMRQAHTKYSKVLHFINQSQKQLDSEVDKAISLIRKSATEMEKNLTHYRKKVMTQRNRLEKMLKAKSAAPSTSKKKTSSKKTTRRTSRRK